MPSTSAVSLHRWRIGECEESGEVDWSMELFPEDSIREFVEWKAANPTHFTWWNYLNVKSDLQTALAFARFYYPEIIETEGYFLLKDKFNLEVFKGWKSECNNDKRSVEKMMNLYEVKDFFHININPNEDLIGQTRWLSEVLQLFWSMSFVHRYPGRRINVHIFDDKGSRFITVYEE
ncbi:hypothetical protein [Paenibacillus glufosinatiresistens]|uniref:hypothetical protein n=1 Tax=Paenibacillus glufosinatiresistens TaxID=3070657 RepID=UPI00286D9610|nr:hypothetical protein [Paenibacillus sp. YX.27]